MDQLHWIALSKIANGKTADPAGILACARSVAASGAVVFPLSAGHYFELHRITDESRREKLGTTMWELSGGATVVDYGALIRYEIGSALVPLFPGRVHPTSLQLLGRGVSHALGKNATIPIPEAARGRYPEAYLVNTQQQIQLEFERSLLTGSSVHLSGRVPRSDLSVPAINFRKGLEKMRHDLASAAPDLRRRALAAGARLDIYEPLVDQLEGAGITWGEFAALGIDRWEQFLGAQPYRRVDCHLRNHWLANPSLRPRDTDFNDWAFVGMAVMYCDIVVTDKQFADLVNRSGLRKRAVVYDKLEKILSHLVP